MKEPLIQHGTRFDLVAPEDQIAERLDIYLHKTFPHYTRSFFQRAIEDGYIQVNDLVAKKAGLPIKAHDRIAITFPHKRNITKEDVGKADIAVRILYTHEHFLIIEKPAGLICHPTTSTSNEISLADWLVHHIDDIAHIGSVDRPGIIHRLDKLTSGLMIIPRTNYAYNLFGIMFRERTIAKTYYALVAGHLPQQGTVDLYIGRDPVERNKMTTYRSPAQAKTKARHAITHYKVEQYFEDASLVRVELETGRTHQIRVHFAAIGHPIIGDMLYNKKSPLIERQALHAAELSFNFDGEKHSFKSNLPEDIQKVIAGLNPVME